MILVVVIGEVELAAFLITALMTAVGAASREISVDAFIFNQ